MSGDRLPLTRPVIGAPEQAAVRDALASGWWVLRELERGGRLGQSCDRTRSSLLDSWPIDVLQPRRPRRNATTAAMMDTFVAEYTLIGLAKQSVRLELR